MKTNLAKLKALLFAVILCNISTMSNADVGDRFAEIKYGLTHISAFDDDADVTSEDKPAFGINLGYQFSPRWAMELEYVQGGTEIRDKFLTLDADITTFAGYATYRSAGDFYFIGKIGIVQYKLDANFTSDFTESGMSFGLGSGYRLLFNLDLELSYTVVAADTDWFMLSARYNFR